MKIALGILTVLFLSSGVLHLVNPDAFMWLMPPWLPWATFLIYLSGVLELISAVGLADCSFRTARCDVCKCTRRGFAAAYKLR